MAVLHILPLRLSLASAYPQRSATDPGYSTHPNLSIRMMKRGPVLAVHLLCITTTLKLIQRPITDMNTMIAFCRRYAFFYMILIVGVGLAGMSPNNNKKYGFRGLYIRMSLDDVNKLVAETDWEYLTNDASEANTPKKLEPGDPVLLLQCTEGPVPSLTRHVMCTFYKDTVMSIVINSPYLPDSQLHELRDCLDSTIHTITEMFGTPTQTPRSTFDALKIQPQSKAYPETITTYAKWIFNEGKNGVDVYNVFVSTARDPKPYYIRGNSDPVNSVAVYIQDFVRYTQYRKEVQGK